MDAEPSDQAGSAYQILAPLSLRDLRQILAAMENRGDDRNDDPQWRDLYDRLHAYLQEF